MNSSDFFGCRFSAWSNVAIVVPLIPHEHVRGLCVVQVRLPVKGGGLGAASGSIDSSTKTWWRPTPQHAQMRHIRLIGFKFEWF